MIKRIYAFLRLFLLSLITSSVYAEVLELPYQGFTIWLDCEKRAAAKFEYHVGVDKDTDNVSRDDHKCCTFDATIPSSCRQLSFKPYGSHTGFGRGHLVPFNHMDYSVDAAKESNYMVNILPQASDMNRKGGAWYQTEQITECFREYHPPLTVIVGPIWSSNSHQLESHGILVPDYFWKVISHSNDSIAWIIPNSDEATKDKLDEYLVTLEKIEKKTGYVIPVDKTWKTIKQSSSWDIIYCDEGGPKDWRK